MGERSLSFQSVWVVAAVVTGTAIALIRLESTAVAIAIGIFAVSVLLSPIAALSIMLGVAPLRTLIATESPGLFPVDIGQLAFAAVVASWLFHHLIRKRPFSTALRPFPVLCAVAIFLVASGLTAFAAHSTQAWLTEWLKWVQIAMLIVIVADTGRYGGWQWLVFGLVNAALANAVIGIYEYFGGSGALHLVVEERYFRAFGTFGQPNPFGGFMGLIAPVAIMSALAAAVRYWRNRRNPEYAVLFLATAFYYTAAAGVISFALYVSWSRGAWLGFAASCAVLLIALPRRTWLSFGIVVAGSVFLGLAIVSGRIPASILNRLSSITNELTSTGDVRGVDVTPENYANVERLAHWQAAVNMGTAHPWLGVGFGNYEVAYPEFSLLYWDIPLGHAHNYYLNVFAETGMIGTLAYGVMFLTVIVVSWRLRKHPDSAVRLIGIGAIGSWVYLSIHSLTDNLYVNNLFLHIGTLFALVTVLYDQLSNDTNAWLRTE